MRKISYIAGLVAILTLAVFLVSSATQNTMPDPVRTAENNKAQPSPASQVPHKNVTPNFEIDQNKSYKATLKTTEGDIIIKLNAKTPKTVANFVNLSKNDFYDDTIFHRVINGFMIQGGDPKGDGTGGPGYQFEDELFEGEYARGTVAMANAGPDTNGSQFFIIHQDSDLPKNYVIFGKVIDGLDVVDKIAEASVTVNASGERSKPLNPVTINSIEISQQ